MILYWAIPEKTNKQGGGVGGEDIKFAGRGIEEKAFENCRS